MKYNSWTVPATLLIIHYNVITMLNEEEARTDTVGLKSAYDKGV